MAVRLKDRIEANIRQSDKVNNSLSIQLNSGTATVYDGSEAKTINITPAAIGAASSSHTHSYLPLAGGTMTGSITRQSTSTAGTSSAPNGSATTATLFTLSSTGALTGVDYYIRYSGRIKARDTSTTYYYSPAKLYIDSYSYNSSTGARLSYYYRFYFPRASANLTSSRTSLYFPFVASSAVGNSTKPVYVNAQHEIVACEDFVGLVSVAATEPTNDKYTLWVDTSEDAAAAMPADAVKYKAFTITTDQWSGEGPFVHRLSTIGVTENSAVINLTLDAESQNYQKEQLNWETGENFVELSTDTKPAGTLTGYLIAVQVCIV